MNGRYVHVPPHGERKRNDIFTARNQCVSTRNKHLYNIYMYFFEFFFFPFISLSCIKKGLVFVMKGFHCNKKISYIFSCLGGNKIKSILKFKMRVKLWTAIAM